MKKIEFLDFETSSYCGADCIMCPRKDQYVDRDKTMGFDIYKKILDEAAKDFDLKAIRFCGIGDPFMDKTLIDKLKYTKSIYPSIVISVTNTMHVYNEELFQYIDTLVISHYGFSKESFEAVHRGCLEYEKIRENIEKLLAIPEKLRPYISMTFVMLPQNEHEKDEWINYWGERVNEIVVWKPHNWSGNVTGIASQIPNVGNPHTCGRPFKDITVRASGKVTVCCADFNCKLQIGDLTKDSLADILEGEELKRLQKIHREGAFFEQEVYCNKCDQIFDREDALIYHSKERKVGSIFIGDKKGIDLR